jgi:type I restriction-modification system DNA methylase subunit
MSTCAWCNKTYKNAAGLAIHMRSCKASGAVKSSIKTPKARTIPAALMELIGHEADQVQLDPQYIEPHIEQPIEKTPKAARKRGKQAIEQLGEVKLPASEIKCDDSQNNTILAIVNKCHNIMRDQQAITGMIAYQDIIKLLFLRFMEPELSGKLAHLLDPKQYENITDIFDKPFVPSDVQLLRFSALRDPKIAGLGEAFKRSIYMAWDMLSKNSYTKHIFEDGERFKCNMTTLYICLEEIGLALEKVNFDKLSTDIKGDIYEHFVNGYADHKGKDFGQFFTPRKMIKLIFKLNAHLFPDFKPTSIYDPCAGTGGFLTEMHKICKCPLENIHGGEIEPSTFASLAMNLLLSTGSICDVEQRNSLEFTKKEQYDWIGTNPPFGTEIKYDEMLILPPPTIDFTKKELYPYDLNDGSALFLQSCAAHLKPGGVCNIVLPYGEIFSSKRKVFQKLREYMILNYDIRAVLIVPSGVFTHTNVSTVVMYFATGKTSAITFYETDLTCKEFKETKRLTLNELSANKYNLLLKSYDAKIKLTLIDSTWTIKKFADIFPNNKSGKFNSSDCRSEGKYPFYTGKAKNPSGFSDNYCFDYPEYLIMIRGGGAGEKKYGDQIGLGKIFLASGRTGSSSSQTAFIPIKGVNIKYLYYYLCSIKNQIMDLAKYTTGLGHINISDLDEIEIPICSSEKQQEIVTRYEAYDAEIKQCTERIKFIENEKNNNFK